MCNHKANWIYPKARILAKNKKSPAEKVALKTVICEDCGMLGYSINGLTSIHWHWWGRHNGKNDYEKFVYRQAAEVWDRLGITMPVYLSFRCV